MKKKQHDGDILKYFRKTLRIMRLSLFLIIISTAMAFSANSYSQNAKLSMDLNNATVKEVIKAIEKQSEFLFFYQEKHVNLNRQVTLHATGQDVETILDQVFAGTDNIYVINDRQIVIGKAPRKELEKQIQSIKGNVKPVIDQPQQKEITGKVTDTGSLPLPGVTVIVKGTTIGTVTNGDGDFSLAIPDRAETLQFSFVGMKTRELAIEGRTTFAVVMEEDVVGIEEVVAIGYGSQKRADITGSVVSVPKDRLTNLPVSNILQAIQGTTAGLQITQESSIPGSSASVLIRGVNSINASNTPLIVLDGIPFFGVTNDINANDISSIEVLKDASAVAIYGTRGSNGVILITTKRGKKSDGKPTVTYSGYYGVESMSNPIKYMGPDAYVKKYVDFLTANNQSQTAVLPNASEVENYDQGITTDWINEATQPGSIQGHDISISSGGDKSQYFLSASHLDQEGVVKGYEYQKTTLRFNADSEITDWLKIGATAFFTHNDYGSGKVNFLEATAMSPYSVPRDEKGDYIIYPMSPELLFRNPLLGLTVDSKSINRNLSGTGFLEATPIKGLKYRMNASYTFTLDRLSSYSGRANNDQSGTARARSAERDNWVVENILTYTKNIDKHNFDATALYSAQKVDYFQFEAAGVGFVNDGLSYYDLSAGTTQSANSQGNGYTLLSQMGRINYSYDSRYSLTLTARRDGYSAFGANTNKTGIFPSAALAWNINNESFLKDSKIVNALKLRISYGKTGNQAIAVNQTATTATSVKFPFSGTVVTGVQFQSLGNANLNWETTTSSNIAVDFSLLDNRIGGSVEAYKSKTEDILLRRNVPAVSGYSNIWSNLGSMQNTGFELTVNTVNVKDKYFTWKSSINFSTYRNKILELYGDGKDDIGNRWFIGEALGVFYDYEKLGIWQEGEDIASVDPTAKPGYIKFADQITVDTDGDGIPDAKDGKINADDRIILGRTSPKWVGGLTNTFQYKNISLSVFLQMSNGGLRSNRDMAYADEAGRRNLPADFQYWTPENKNNYWPSLASSKHALSVGYGNPEDYSFVRIKDVRLGYVFPLSICDKWGLKGLTVYAAGRNLHTFTKWYGWDPELNAVSRGSTGWQDNYPQVRTISLGLNVTL